MQQKEKKSPMLLLLEEAERKAIASGCPPEIIENFRRLQREEPEARKKRKLPNKQ